MLITIHEFTHALELYEEIGLVYEERKNARENKTKHMGKLYIILKKNVK